MMSTTWSAPQRKRGREEEFADISPGGTLGFTEHRSKRIQSLPLRTSPNSKRWAEPPRLSAQASSFPMPSQPRTITPGSDTEAVVVEHCGWADEPELITEDASADMMVDCDMDMMDTSEAAHSSNHAYLSPGRFQNEPVASVAGRIPTPIHCTFAAQLRGSNWNEAPHIPLATTPEEPTAMAFCNNGMADMTVHENVHPNPQSLVDWNMVQNRRLPSPISENGGEEGMENPHLMMDPTSQHSPGGHLSHLTHQHPLIAGIPHREVTPVADSPHGNAMDVESPGPGTPSPKRGHTRSRHTVNSWTTLQPGMKRSFSIGFRSDCEKCRMKVPGHFNHIVIS
ncbi:hypothetical protein QBC43DRAFT_31098 [Cladorrhinum sp. PSN259]|nr:hypothetical protein QBC43DRAFT_31098 [Cladorrhinum sp. PSN259]